MNAELYISLVSVVIALSAFGVAIWQGVVNRNHNILSVRPLLHINIDDSQGLNYFLESHGVGPCVFHEFIIIANEKVFKNPVLDPYPQILQHLNIFENIEYEYYLPSNKASLSSATTKLLFSVKAKDFSVSPAVFKKLEESLEFIVIYKSVYENKLFACGSKTHP